MFWLASTAAAQAPPASGPSVMIDLPASAPAPVGSIADRIAPTAVERTVLDAVLDGTQQRFDETGLYVMLGLAGRAPTLELIEWHELDRPAYGNLLADPAHYRAKPFRAKVRIFHVRKLQSGAGLGFNQFWPKDRPIWQIDCIWTDEPNEKEKPIIIYSVADPTPLIGQPDGVDAQNRQTYGRGRDLRIAALFYKVTYERQGSGSAFRQYPVAMAWQLSRLVTWKGTGQWSTQSLTQLGLLLVLVILMGGGFYYTRRRLAKLRKQNKDSARTYRPLRFETDRDPDDGPAGTAESDRDRQDEEVLDGPVDPELTAAVEEFLQERQRDDERDA